MKKVLLIIAMLITAAMTTRAQKSDYALVQLRATEKEIRSMFPYVSFEYHNSDNGTPYLERRWDDEWFCYYFSKETGDCFEVFEQPTTQGRINQLAEIYNKKYAITSERSWTAYLDGGRIQYIKMVYIEATGKFAFTYRTDDVESPHDGK